MSDWNLINDHTLEHRCGFKIHLKRGNWLAPQDVDTSNIPDIEPLRAAQLYADGLIFARAQSRPRAYQMRQKGLLQASA